MDVHTLFIALVTTAFVLMSKVSDGVGRNCGRGGLDGVNGIVRRRLSGRDVKLTKLSFSCGMVSIIPASLRQFKSYDSVRFQVCRRR